MLPASRRRRAGLVHQEVEEFRIAGSALDDGLIEPVDAVLAIDRLELRGLLCDRCVGAARDLSDRCDVDVREKSARRGGEQGEESSVRRNGVVRRMRGRRMPRFVPQASRR